MEWNGFLCLRKEVLSQSLLWNDILTIINSLKANVEQSSVVLYNHSNNTEIYSVLN